jgi:hypothetical protein
MLRQSFLNDVDDAIVTEEWGAETAERLYWRLDIGLSQLYNLDPKDKGAKAVELAALLYLYAKAVEQE